VEAKNALSDYFYGKVRTAHPTTNWLANTSALRTLRQTD